MSLLMMATIGGLISFMSTSLGAVVSFFSSKVKTSFRWSLSIDFALGLMISASAFTLIGPVAVESSARGPQSLQNILLATSVGVIFVVLMKQVLQGLQKTGSVATNHLLLASVLMLHNFPEGLASGAALAGLGWSASLPILGGISLQNIPEGALMVFCLRSMGWRNSFALMGGLGSGLVEMSGGILSGFLMSSLDNILPILLSAAGGAMIASVCYELLEGEGNVWQRVLSRQFLGGFIFLPIIQYLGS